MCISQMLERLFDASFPSTLQPMVLSKTMASMLFHFFVCGHYQLVIALFYCILLELLCCRLDLMVGNRPFFSVSQQPINKALIRWKIMENYNFSLFSTAFETPYQTRHNLECDASNILKKKKKLRERHVSSLCYCASLFLFLITFLT